MTRTDGMLAVFVVALLGLDVFAVIGKLELGAAVALGAAGLGLCGYGIAWIRERWIAAARSECR